MNGQSVRPWVESFAVVLAVVVGWEAASRAGGEVNAPISYQGQLKRDGTPASGVFDFQFTLLQDDGVTLVDRTCVFDIVVVNGLFQAELEFAAASLDGSPRLLQVGVRNAAGGIHDCTSNTIGFLFDLLTPLQPITAAPYALHAFSAAPGSSLNAPDGAPINALVVNNAGNVGIGTTSPTATLDVSATTTSARLTSTGTTGASLQLVQPNALLVAENLGRISFSSGALDADGSTRAEITFANNLNTSLRFSFATVSGLTSTVERMRILQTGNVGIGTASPANLLSVNGGADFAGNVGIGTTSPTAKLHVAGTAGIDGIRFPDGTLQRSAAVGDGHSLDASDGSPVNALVVDANGDVGIGVTGSIDARLHVQETGRVAKFDRFGSDGEIVVFARDDGVIGTISNAGGVVSYNAFTGSHYAWSAATIVAGALVSMTGKNRRFGERGDAEVVYGIQETARPNDPACLGVHLGPMESTHELGPENPRLVAAVGNGDMCVVDRGGGDIEPGDYLISSDVPGCAMKDQPARYPTGHIVARAAQPVDWKKSEPDATDVRRAMISVLFTHFDRMGSALRASEVERLRAEVETLRAEKDALASRIARLEALAPRVAVNSEGGRP